MHSLNGLRHARHLGVVLGARAPVRLLVDAEEVELDGESVRILDEHLVELELREVAVARGDADLAEALGELLRLGGEERDVIDDAGVVGGRLRRRAEVVELGVRDAVRAHVDLDLAVHAQPVAGEREVGPLHHLEAEHVAVEALGLLEVVGADEIVVELGDGHGGPP